MPRPKCVHCGKMYGHRLTTDETVKWPLNEPMPSYKGNGVVVKQTQPYKSATKETLLKCRPDFQGARLKHLDDDIAKLPDQSYNVAYRYIWDGQSWFGGYNPFCTLRCALDYARKAYTEAHRLKRGTKI